MDNKKWYMSKTLWFNAVAAIAGFVQTQYGFVISPEMQGLIITGVNFVLRLITKAPVGK